MISDVRVRTFFNVHSEMTVNAFPDDETHERMAVSQNRKELSQENGWR